MTPRLLAAAAALFLLAPARAADPDPVADRMRKDLFFLASEECEGRGVETQGIKKAGQYVADQFKAAGLKPAGADGGYFQPFPVPAGPPKLGTPVSLTLAGPDGAKLEPAYGSEFAAVAGDGKTAAGLVFVGYGITAPDKGYDDYAGVDARGKLVVVLRRTPRAENKDDPFDPANAHAPLAAKAQNAADHKAAGVVFVNDATYGKDGDELLKFRAASGPTAAFPIFHVRRAVANKLLASQGKTLAEVETAIDKDLKPRSVPLTGWEAAAEVTVSRPTVPSRNVVGVAEGSGPLADETVVVGAHYDHVGRAEGADGQGTLGGAAAKGKLHYGADDNASGTTGLIELARRFGAQKNRVGRRVVFVAFSGEERGLYGSKYYVNNPAFPLANTVFMLNLDMIGRVVAVDDGGTQRDRLVVYGTGTAEGMEKVVDAGNAGAGFKLLKVPGGSGPSDHESFYLKKIPVLFFFTGTHRDYHRPTDTPDKINVPGMAKATGLAEKYVAHFAAADRPKYLATKGGWDDPTAPARPATRAKAPKLGVMPGNYQDEDGGVLVDDVSPGGAAEKAGIQAKDVVVEIAGKPVKNINDYMAAMAGQKAGQEIPVVVVRAGKRMTVKVTPLP